MSVIAELKKKAKKVKRRAFKGFKAKLIFNAENVSVETAIRYARLTSQHIKEKMKVKAMSRTYGVEVKQKLVGDFRKAWITEHGVEVPTEDVYYVQEQEDGSEIEVEPFERTEEIMILKLIDRKELDNYLPESTYEIWNETNPNGLFKIADYLDKTQKVGVAHFVARRGFVDYFALIYPRFDNDKFVLQMVLTRTRKVFNRWMPVHAEPTVVIRKKKPKTALEL